MRKRDYGLPKRFCFYCDREFSALWGQIYCCPACEKADARHTYFLRNLKEAEKND